jgi:hypothetical protein
MVPAVSSSFPPLPMMMMMMMTLERLAAATLKLPSPPMQRLIQHHQLQEL